MKLADILNGYRNTVLEQMATERGFRASAKRKKTDLVRELADKGFTPATARQAYERTLPVEREIIARLQRLGGQAQTAGLKQSLLRTGIVSSTPQPKPRSPFYGGIPSQYEANPHYPDRAKPAERETLKPCFEDAAARLALLGLVLSYGVSAPNSSVIDWTPGQTLVIPEPVRKALPPPPAPTLGIIQPPSIVESSARLFLRDLGRYWRSIRRQGAIRLTSQGWVYKATLKDINEMLAVQGDLGSGKSEQENGRLYFLRCLLQTLELAREDGDTIVAVDETGFWSQPAAERIRNALNAWQNTRLWNELLRIPTEKRGYDHRTPAPRELTAARKLILEQMRLVDTGNWVDFENLLDQIRTAHYEFLFARPKTAYALYRSTYAGNASTPYSYSTNPYNISFPEITEEAAGWQLVEAAVIAEMIAGPLFWMGLVDLGLPAGAEYAETISPMAYRLTAFGRWVLGLGPAVDIPAEGGRVVVQPNFTIMAMEPVSDETLITLDQFADPQGGDRVMSYTLSRESVYRGQKSDWPVPRIIEYLESASGRELPPNVRRSLEEWQSTHERITIHRRATVIETADAATMAEIRSHPSLAALVKEPLAPTVVMSNKPNQELIAGLRQAGWLPLVTAEGRADARDRVVADETGELRFALPLPSFYVRNRLVPFSERQDGRWHITRESIREAQRAGQTVDAILTELAAVHRGSVPPRLMRQIKAWGEYYGRASTETITLIEFRDQAALRELLADPELAPHLTEFPAEGRALARVAPGELERVRQLLSERGVPISDGTATE